MEFSSFFGENMENVCLSGRATKYQCIRCETTVCVLCAPEIQNPEDEPEYKPMSKVGICNECNNTAIAGCRVETEDESVLEDMEASNVTRFTLFYVFKIDRFSQLLRYEVVLHFINT